MRNIGMRAMRTRAALGAAVASGALASSILLSDAFMSHAWAGSVAQPGSTLGLPVGAPRPEGIYFENTSSYGERSAAPNGLGVNLTQVVWSTPFRVFDTNIQFFFMQPTSYTTKTANDAFYRNSTLFATRFAHGFGNGFGMSYQAGFRAAAQSPLSFRRNSLDQRAALTYNADGYNLTANLLNGLFFADGANALHADWLNLDLTATKKFGKLEIGPVAYASTDISSPNPAYRRQRQVAVGGFVGYDFGAFRLHAFVTRDVVQRNYAGIDTRGWTRLIVPLYTPTTAPEPLRARF